MKRFLAFSTSCGQGWCGLSAIQLAANIQLKWMNVLLEVKHAVSWADHRLLFPHCSAIIHHGGAGTTQSALRVGLPSIIVAHVSDQFFWGQELERLGVAGPTQRRKGLSARKLRNAIRACLDKPSLAPNAKLLGESMSKENGVESAIRAIENAFR